MIQIIPAILATTEEQYKNNLTRLESVEELQGDFLHIDFADNEFVQNQTVEPDIVEKFPTRFKKEAHLMVSHPKQWINKLVSAGFERIIFHLESNDDPSSVIEDIKSKDLKVGLAINIQTPIEKIEPYIAKIDVALIMAIAIPGFQGQPFSPESLAKVKECNKIRSNNNVLIGIDGAVKSSNIKEIAEAGVDFVTVGSYLLEGDVEENLEILWEEINGT